MAKAKDAEVVTTDEVVAETPKVAYRVYSDRSALVAQVFSEEEAKEEAEKHNGTYSEVI